MVLGLFSAPSARPAQWPEAVISTRTAQSVRAAHSFETTEAHAQPVLQDRVSLRLGDQTLLHCLLEGGAGRGLVSAVELIRGDAQGGRQVCVGGPSRPATEPPDHRGNAVGSGAAV